MDKHSKHCLSSQVQGFIKFILMWKSKEPDWDSSGTFHLTCLLQQSMGQSLGEIITGSHLIEPSHGRAGKEDHERSAGHVSEEVVTVKLHQTKRTTTALMAVHELPCKPLTKLRSKTRGLCDALRRHSHPISCRKFTNNTVQLQRHKI